MDENSKTPALRIRAVSVLLLAATMACATVPGKTEQRFANPEDATRALFDALESDDSSSLVRLFGSAGRGEILSVQWSAGREYRQKIIQGAADLYALRDVSETEVEITIGVERSVFPIPIVTDGASWYFDTQRGLDEVVTRWTGES